MDEKLNRIKDEAKKIIGWGRKKIRETTEYARNRLRPQPSQEEVELLAYYKWVEAGRPDGQSDRFWSEASRELGA